MKIVMYSPVLNHGLSQSLGFACLRDFCPRTVPAVFVPVPSVPRKSVPIPVPSPGISVPGHKSHEIPVTLPIPVLNVDLANENFILSIVVLQPKLLEARRTYSDSISY